MTQETEKIREDINNLHDEAIKWSQDRGELNIAEKDCIEVSLDALQEIATSALDLVDTFSDFNDLDEDNSFATEMAEANKELTDEIALGAKELQEEFETLKMTAKPKNS